MKKVVSKSEVKQNIDDFFKKSFEREEMKKIKRLANKYRISLKEYKKKFCKKCLSELKGKIRVTKRHKTIYCENCNYLNRFKI